MFHESLSEFQKQIVRECIEKKSGGLSLPMGSGKTFISLVLSKIFQGNNGKSLIIVSKTLVNSWIYEIKKFYPECKYHIFHSEYKTKNIYTFEESEIIISTPETATKYYKLYKISDLFIESRTIQVSRYLETITNVYLDSDDPFLKQDTHVYLRVKSSVNDIQGLPLYSQKWKCLFVDEVQKHTNILNEKCKAIASISANHRWLLSGTIISEPKIERILGYYIILNDNGFPRTLPTARVFITSKKFKGLNDSFVLRHTNENFNNQPELIQKIIEHPMTADEIEIYMSIKIIMANFQKKFQKYKNDNNVGMSRKFTGYIMALLGYLRQSLVCPLVPLSSACVDALDISSDNIMAKTLVNTIKENVSEKYLSSEQSVYSSRVRSVNETLELHVNEKVVLFSCYRTSIDIISFYISKNRPFFTIKGSDNLVKRNEIIEAFKNSKNGILGLTYEMGSEGLNLQFASTALLVDFFWNDATTSQAIARVFRYGQVSKKVNIYLFTSNTGIENAIFKKQKNKLEIIAELNIGSTNNKVKNLNMNDVIQMINTKENHHILMETRTCN